MSIEEIQVLNRKVDRILSYLHNDEGTGTKGLVAEVADLKKNFNDFMISYKLEKAFKKGQIGIIAFIGGGLVLLVEWLIKIIF